MKQQRPLVEALQRFVRNEPHSLHVPGHKNGIFSTLPNELKAAMQYDVTELTGLDDFHHPEGAIKEAETLLAKVYKADRSFFLVNGSTVGNLAMIYATCEAGDTILVQRNAHKSIFHALELVGVNPVYLAPEWHETSLTAGHVSTETIKEAIKRYPHAKAVVLTYPTYYGVATEQLTEQIIYCHEAGIPVLVDEARGAHLIASHYLPSSALMLGADVVVQSAHKTLPAMTMASFMHVKSSLVDVEKVNHYLRMLQSSSPSYLLLASLDDARAYIADYTEIDFAAFMDKRAHFIESVRAIDGLEIVEVDDSLKLLLRAPGYTGFQLKDVLEAHHVYSELADREQVLFILPLMKQGQIYPFADIRLRIKESMVALTKKPAEPYLPTKGLAVPSIM
ncbi:MAG: aminotransferase class I/II-fold pyridoxal phosphate-dependent enzyme, partial [Caryophanon sp.]|nr:aminotransferase class I/II-fold pyridoxal phosphate-dependent enzyme [Caryophanon sp.]